MASRFFRIMVVEDDEDDRLLIGDALLECGVDLNQVEFVEDGEQALERLESQQSAGDPKAMTQLMLLDWNMPRMGGQEVLKAMRDSDTLSLIPVIVLTTSQSEQDIKQTYLLGGRSFISKPSSFDRLVAIMSRLKTYWQDVVTLPGSNPF